MVLVLILHPPPWDGKGVHFYSIPTGTSVDLCLLNHQLLASCKTATFFSQGCGCEVIPNYKAKSITLDQTSHPGHPNTSPKKPPKTKTERKLQPRPQFCIQTFLYKFILGEKKKNKRIFIPGEISVSDIKNRGT